MPELYYKTSSTNHIHQPVSVFGNTNGEEIKLFIKEMLVKLIFFKLLTLLVLRVSIYGQLRSFLGDSGPGPKTLYKITKIYSRLSMGYTICLPHAEI